MSGLTIEIEGIRDMVAEIRAAGVEAIRKAEDAVNRTTLKVQTSAIRRIQGGPKTGITYDKSNPNRTHQASAPGESPATDTGRLVSSIETDIKGLTGYVFTRVDYGAYLEFGTSKILARPWLNPALEENAGYFEDQLSRILE